VKDKAFEVTRVFESFVVEKFVRKILNSIFDSIFLYLLILGIVSFILIVGGWRLAFGCWLLAIGC